MKKPRIKGTSKGLKRGGIIVAFPRLGHEVLDAVVGSGGYCHQQGQEDGEAAIDVVQPDELDFACAAPPGRRTTGKTPPVQGRKAGCGRC